MLKKLLNKLYDYCNKKEPTSKWKDAEQCILKT